MKAALLFVFASLLFVLDAGIAAESPAGRVPVLLELFTSEGCSSCPPADQLLRKLDSEQPVPGAELIVLSEHVDYWNHLGWRDPFSSAQFSERQGAYARSLGGGDVYTPELVVDGAKGLNGSNEGEARREIQSALREPMTPIHLQVGPAKISIHIDRAVEGTLYLALAHDAAKSQVLRGENSGRALAHVAVVYSLQKIAKLDRKSPAFDRDVPFDRKPGDSTRIVAFVAKPDMGRVVAVGQARL
jgi:hypothetical protein